MAQRRRKARNPNTPWLKYVLIAGGCYAVYRMLKSGGMLGNGGYDELPKPSPVVRKVAKIVTSTKPVYGPTDPLRNVRASYAAYTDVEKVNAAFVEKQTKAARDVNERLREAKAAHRSAAYIKNIQDELKGKEDFVIGAVKAYKRNVTAAEEKLVKTTAEVVRGVQDNPESFKVLAAKQKYKPELATDLAKIAQNLDAFLRAAELVVSAEK